MTRFGDMKTIVNKIRFALLLGFMVIGMTAWSQIPNIEKLSVSTQMFLDELAGNVNWDKTRQPIKTTSNADIVDPNIEIYERPIARPDTIDGMVYVSSFIRVTNDDDINTLESMGVKIECRFDNGLLTALIPVDKILDVAAIDDVKRIEVATVMHTATDNARQTTNADDVLTLSQDAIAAGLDHQYDGSGIILGVIDTGIDYQHKAFQDKNGNSRIKGVYCYGSSSVLADWTGSGTLPTTDNSAKDHGSHTSSIAGGSNVIVNGTDVTVTDDPASATYGGMAPGVDLFLAGVNTLYSTRISNAFQKMVNYANQQGKPLVVSNSYGSTTGPHEGNGAYAEVVNNYFGNNVSNRICLFSAGNSAGNADATEGGGGFISGTASSSNPLRTILRCHYYSNRDNGYYYSGDLASAWCRSTSVSSMGCRVMVLDTRTGAVLTTVTVNPTTGGATVNGLSTYYSGTLKAYKDYVSSDKTQIFLTASEDMKSTSYDTSNSSFYTSDYTLAVEFYPTSGSAVIDVWAQEYCYFTDYLTTSGYNWVNGSDDMTVNDFANNTNTIVVGSYVSRERSSGYSLGDISKFSSYATAEANPMGMALPWITAPGEVIIGAYNHNNTSRGSSYVVSVNNSTSPYGQMSGTSMACPSAAGIVALWLQAANEVGKVLTLSEVKEIMKETAIRDYWVTDGPHASHFGNGKIDALAGIEYILSHYAIPTITANPNSVTFTTAPGSSASQTVTVTSILLTGNITVTLDDPNGVYSINTTNLGHGGNLVITYNPATAGNHSATITLTSPGAEPVTITIIGMAEVKHDDTICDGTGSNAYLPVYGYYYDEAQTNQMLYPSTKFTGNGMAGNKITKVTFYPTTGTYYGTTYSGINFYKNDAGTGTVTVKLANMPSGTAGYNATASRKNADFVTVKTITMPTSAQTNLTEWVFEDLENDFTYTGGDLLIEVVTTVGRWGRTFFAGENQNTYTGYYSYGSTSTGQRFLPKVNFEWADATPVVAGSVSPTDITFSDVIIGKQSKQNVTITNTGNQAFTPTIDTTNLPSVFTVTGNGQVMPGGSLNLSVKYTPTDEGPHSGSFTVTIGDQTYTVTVTGNGFVVNSTLHSNVVDVPAYHSGLEVKGSVYQFTEDEVIADGDMHLQYEGDDSDVKVLVKSDEPISGYELKRRDGEEGSWQLAGYAQHQGNSYVLNETSMTFGDGETEMWFPMNDYTTKTEAVTYYVPVTVANGVVTTGNTYGAPIVPKANDDVALNVIISGSKSDKRLGGHWTHLPDSVEYCVYTTIVDISSNDMDGVVRKPYLYRAWVVTTGDHPIYNFTRNDKNAIVGTDELETPYLLGEIGIEENDYGSGQHVVIGQEWDPNSGVVKMQNAFGAPSYGAQISVVVRAYYRSGNSQTMMRAARNGGEFGFAQSGGDEQFDLPTGVMEVIDFKEIVDVTYVNAMGMMSSKPFDGLNIVVTRYSDGTTQTMKVMK